MGLDQAYTQVGQAGNVQNINPTSEGFWNTLFSPSGVYNTALGNLGTLGGQMQQLVSQAGRVGYEPQAGFSQFLSQVPQYQQLAQSAVAPFATAAGSYADLASQQARQAVEAQYAQRGNVYTGGFGKAVTQAMAQPYYQAAMQTQQLQSGLLGNLFSTGRQTAEQAYAQSVATQLQGLGLGAEMLGTQYQGQLGLAGSALGAGAQMAQPEWWQPSYVENSNYWGNWVPQLAGTVIGGALGNPFVGAALGEGISSLFTSPAQAPSAPTPQWVYGFGSPGQGIG